MVRGSSTKIGDNIKISIKDTGTLEDGEIEDLHQEDQLITEREHNLVFATLEAIIEKDLSLVIEMYTEENLTPEAVRTIVINHEHLVTSQDASDITAKLVTR